MNMQFYELLKLAEERLSMIKEQLNIELCSLNMEHDLPCHYVEIVGDNSAVDYSLDYRGYYTIVDSDDAGEFSWEVSDVTEVALMEVLVSDHITVKVKNALSRTEKTVCKFTLDFDWSEFE